MNNYHSLAKCLQLVDQKQGNFKSAILQKQFKQKIPASDYKRAYSIIIKTYKLLEKIKEFISECLTKKDIKVDNVYLFAIQVNEYFFGKLKKSKAGGKIKTIIKNHEIAIAKYLDIDKPENNNQKQFQIRQQVYVRIKNGKMNIDSLGLPAIQDNLIPNLYKLEYSDYQTLTKTMQTDKNLKQNLIIQGKSSCLTPYVLLHNNTLEKFDIIDTCSAPGKLFNKQIINKGNKTQQLSEYSLNKGKVFAFEIDKNRHKLLQKRMTEYEAKNVECICADFLKTDPNESKYSNVKYIQVDPSCSGSGMLNNLFFKNKSQNISNTFQQECKEQYQNLDKEQKDRVEKLSNFQVQIVQHAMQFPSVQQIAYSTCSLYEQENEMVVKRLLEENTNYELVQACSSWDQEFGFEKDLSFCLRTNPFVNNIDGFFVALFKRKN